jgi:hypothetical protein
MIQVTRAEALSLPKGVSGMIAQFVGEEFRELWESLSE